VEGGCRNFLYSGRISRSSVESVGSAIVVAPRGPNPGGNAIFFRGTLAGQNTDICEGV
jgi:hypothetical protein